MPSDRLSDWVRLEDKNSNFGSFLRSHLDSSVIYPAEGADLSNKKNWMTLQFQRAV
jgi:hypothetical protein